MNLARGMLRHGENRLNQTEMFDEVLELNRIRIVCLNVFHFAHYRTQCPLIG